MAITSMIAAVSILPLSEVVVLDSDGAAVDCEAALFKFVVPGVAKITRVDGTVIVAMIEGSSLVF